MDGNRSVEVTGHYQVYNWVVKVKCCGSRVDIKVDNRKEIEE